MARKVDKEIPDGLVSFITPSDDTRTADQLLETLRPPTPVGTEREFRTLVNLLNAPPDKIEKAETDIRRIARILLVFSNDRSPRISGVLTALSDIEKLAAKLERKLYHLSFTASNFVHKRLNESGSPTNAITLKLNVADDRERQFYDLAPAVFRVVDESRPVLRTDDAMLVLTAIADAAAKARGDIKAKHGPDVGGPNRSMDRLELGHPKVRLIKSAIRLFAWANGRDSVKASTDGDCYLFAAALHQYTTGRPLRMEKEFKALVREWRSHITKNESNSKG